MLAYRNYINLKSRDLLLTLPENFSGKSVEVIILENNNNREIRKTDIDNKANLIFKPYNFGLKDSGFTFSREDIYD
ncbi:MAG: hypothetical protein RO257_05870 [Candidatus Kapabacteria bacterium]|nr:hypothetical protein [Candidatus Kapabacteria bacterium]